MRAPHLTRALSGAVAAALLVGSVPVAAAGVPVSAVNRAAVQITAETESLTPVPALPLTAPAAAGCAPLAQRSTAARVTKAADDGPHSPANRVPASLGVSCPEGATVLDFDLGDVDLERSPGKDTFRSPVRGVLALPRDAANAPLVIVSHLRASNCADGSLAYPCPAGRERRLDRGMTYLGTHLARLGYAVLIPDVAPVWVGQSMAPPNGDYDQQKAWLRVVGTLRDRVAAASKGPDRVLGSRVIGRIDMSKAGLVVHSRSGYVAGPAITAWAQGPTPITTVLAYGPAYDAAPGEALTPAMPDVPYLALEGTKDNDVPFKASRWLGTHITGRRSAPALVAGVPGYGHNYVNRALSAARADDRPACDATCLPASAHEKLLSEAARTWFDATLRGRPASGLPMSAGNRLPAQLAGVPTTWLAATNSARSLLFDSARVGASTTRPAVGPALTTCRFYDPMDPQSHTDACPEPRRGVVEVNGPLVHTTLTRTSGVRLDAGGRRARVLVVHAAPYGDRSDGAAHSPLRATLRLVGGRNITIDVPRSAALRNRATPSVDGTYPLATVRAALPKEFQGRRVESVTLTSGSSRQTALALRAVEIA